MHILLRRAWYFWTPSFHYFCSQNQLYHRKVWKEYWHSKFLMQMKWEIPSVLDGISFMLFLKDIRESKYCRKHTEGLQVQWAERISIICSLIVWLISMRDCFISCKWSWFFLVTYASNFFIATLMKSDNYANICVCMVRRWGKGKKREALQCKSGLENRYVILKTLIP